MANLWYKEAIVYALTIDSFKDSNNDGIGDLHGLQESLNFFKLLGVNCLWLQPFYKSPKKDDGYDVSDYYQVNSELGDLGDFVTFMEAAKATGLRIIIDLVVNHTSTAHPWFIESAKNPQSKYRDYYIWSDQKPEQKNQDAILGEEQRYTNWTYHPGAEAFYYHTFYDNQPDLNMTNPRVVAEVKKIMRFWLKLGVDGFRIDAAAHIIANKGKHKFRFDRHDVFREWRTFLKESYPDAVFLAEVDVPPTGFLDYLEKNRQMHMLFNFHLNNYLFLAFAREDATPILRALRKIPKLSTEEQLANFLRNHDELDLEQLTDIERQEVFTIFAPEEDMRIFDRGIRRRLAPMFKNDKRRLALAYSILFSLPGTPILRYGQEIGMGDDLTKKGRKSVRTVMQWNADRNGGFSNVKSGAIAHRLIEAGEYSYKQVNVKAQLKDNESLLNTVRVLIQARKNLNIANAKLHIIPTDNLHCLAYCYKDKKQSTYILHNLCKDRISIQLNMEETEQYTEVLANRGSRRAKNKGNKIMLSPYGYFWMTKNTVF